MATFAIEGGSRIVPEGMVQSWPPLNQADRDAVLAVFDSGHLHGTSAPKALEDTTGGAIVSSAVNRRHEVPGSATERATVRLTGSFHELTADDARIVAVEVTR